METHREQIESTMMVAIKATMMMMIMMMMTMTVTMTIHPSTTTTWTNSYVMHTQSRSLIRRLLSMPNTTTEKTARWVEF